MDDTDKFDSLISSLPSTPQEEPGEMSIDEELQNRLERLRSFIKSKEYNEDSLINSLPSTPQEEPGKMSIDEELQNRLGQLKSFNKSKEKDAKVSVKAV
ncbi:hypothetical protein OQB17_004656 [Salmonella enterica]|nr:hypothetical protein [Salmonella enterica]